MIHARRKKEARDTQLVAISCICNMTASPDLCPLLIEQKGVEHVLDLIYTEDDAIRSRAAQTLLNLAYSKVDAVIENLLSKKHIKKIVRLMVRLPEHSGLHSLLS